MSYLARLKNLRACPEASDISAKSPFVTFVTTPPAHPESFSAPETPRDAPHCERCNWSAEDWRYAYDERAAIAEHDGRAIPSEAERLAKQEVLASFMRAHMPEPRGEGCLFCGHPTGDLRPCIRQGRAERAHDECWTAHRHAAESALRQMGVIP